MFVLIKKNRIHTTGAESASSKNFTDYESALREFYQNLSNNVADASVERFDITILNGDLIPCKAEHFVREYPEEAVEE